MHHMIAVAEENRCLVEQKQKNLVGKRFGKLTAIELLPESTKNKNRQYLCECDCGNKVVVNAIYLTTGQTRSCGCLISYYNIYIQKLLDKLNIKYEKEHRIYVEGKRYRFDFYLYEYNLMIEYDGEQHYKPMRYHKDDERNYQDFLKRQERDKIKNKYCEDNNIELLRIPYYEKENIDSIIINRLQRLNKRGIA